MIFEDELKLIDGTQRRFPTSYAAPYTRAVVARSLIDAIWSSGSFRFGDLAVSLEWTLPESGDEAYETSIDAAAQYLDGLGLEFNCSLADVAAPLFLQSVVALSRNTEESDTYVETPFRSENPSLGPRKLPDTFVEDEYSWAVFVPFDTSEYVLGSSLLAQAKSLDGMTAPQVADPDYFIDSFEVVRELVEDGVVLSGCTVGEGGLAKALNTMCSGGSGLKVELNDLARSSGEHKVENLLFSEVPGVLIQIKDDDFDYLDAEFLLQDVAYFPLGHPSIKCSEVEVNMSENNGIQQILDSLINNN